MKTLLDLYFTFFKMGAVTFGGGYAMLPILQREIVEKRAWATDEDLMDYYAIGQCTPGIIAVNTATFIGNKIKGVWGGIAATLGIISPSLVIITVIAAFITNFSDLAVVRNAFAGIRVCVFVLIFNAVLKLGKSSIVDTAALLVFLAVFALSFFTDIPVYLMVIAAGVSGIIIKKAKGDFK
jgi:chromate transporter